MDTVLVTYGSRIGPTAAIARRIGAQLAERGLTAEVLPTSRALDAANYRAVIIGSSVYRHRWNADALHYLADQAPDLAERPTWLFQTCALAAETANHVTATPRLVFQLCQDIGVALPRTFVADVNFNNGKSKLARLVSRGDLARKLHNYDPICDWADTIADQLQSEAASAV